VKREDLTTAENGEEVPCRDEGGNGHQTPTKSEGAVELGFSQRAGGSPLVPAPKSLGYANSVERKKGKDQKNNLGIK